MRTASNDNSNVLSFTPKNCIVANGMVIPYVRISHAFKSGQLTSAELARVFKRYPNFHQWFIFDNRSVFA